LLGCWAALYSCSAEAIYILQGCRYMAVTVFGLKRHDGKQGYWKLGYVHITL